MGGWWCPLGEESTDPDVLKSDGDSFLHQHGLASHWVSAEGWGRVSYLLDGGQAVVLCPSVMKREESSVTLHLHMH